MLFRSTEENKTRVVALRRAVAQARTSDVGPERAGAAAATTQERIDAKVSEQLEDWKLMTPAYRAALRSDPDKAAAMEKAQEAKIRARFAAPTAAAPGSPIPLPSGGSNVPPPPAGFVPQ